MAVLLLAQIALLSSLVSPCHCSISFLRESSYYSDTLLNDLDLALAFDDLAHDARLGEGPARGLEAVGPDDDDEAQAHVERAPHLLLRHVAAPLELSEHGVGLPGVLAEHGLAPARQDPRHVLDEAA